LKSDVQNTNEAIDSKYSTHLTGVSDEIDQVDQTDQIDEIDEINQMRMAIITPDPTHPSLPI